VRRQRAGVLDLLARLEGRHRAHLAARRRRAAGLRARERGLQLAGVELALGAVDVVLV
jgi:hypothetical protein